MVVQVYFYNFLYNAILSFLHLLKYTHWCTTLGRCQNVARFGVCLIAEEGFSTVAGVRGAIGHRVQEPRVVHLFFPCFRVQGSIAQSKVVAQ